MADPKPLGGVMVMLTPDLLVSVQCTDGDGKIVHSFALDKAGALDHASKIETLAKLIPDTAPPTRKLQS